MVPDKQDIYILAGVTGAVTVLEQPAVASLGSDALEYLNLTLKEEIKNLKKTADTEK